MSDFQHPNTNQEKREFPREMVRLRAEVLLEIRGMVRVIKAETVDVSYRGIRLMTLAHVADVVLGQAAAVRIALTDDLPLSQCHAVFICQLARHYEGELGLYLTDPDIWGEHGQVGASPVAVRRSDGRLEEGWLALPHGADIPHHIRAKLRAFASKNADQGLMAVVCCKPPVLPGGKTDFKVVNLLELIETQRHVRRLLTAEAPEE
ncbi:MAG: hypothetical protein HQL51_04655 [Magnetococcales bacterium]|nr:hypothetical protein [Magnetococcales bacterium]